MKCQRSERGVALVVVLGILALFLMVAILILVMTSQNSENVGNAYQKQTYYNVAEAGIDRGLADLDTALPSPGAAGFLTATPAPPPSPPTSNQTPLPNEPNIPYFYSYWFNPNSTPTSTPDPLAGTQFCASCTTVNVPAKGGVIWSYTQTGHRDVAVEAVVTRFNESTSSCAICAAQSVTVTGANNKLVVPTPPAATVCGNPSNPFKVCSDPKASPSAAPTDVPIVTGGSYTCSGPEPSPCAWGDGASTPNPSIIQQSVSSSTISNFLASQGTIDQLANAAAWKLAANGTTIQYIDCSSGCSQSALSAVAPSAGALTFVKGNVSWSPASTLSYGGTWVISGCLNISQPGFSGTSAQATAIVLGTDSQCGGTAASIQGGGSKSPPLWDGGTLYAAQGSVSIAGNGSVKGYNFYGAVVAAGSVTVSGNGFFAWQSAAVAQALHFLPFAIVSFAQY